MAAEICIIQAASNTSSGSQSFTHPTATFTPVAARFIVTAGTVAGTAASHAMISEGAATSATEEWAVGMFEEDGQAAEDGQRSIRDNRCIVILDDGGATATAEFTNFTAVGGKSTATINWVVAPSTAYLVTVILYDSAAFSAHAGVHAPGSAAANVTAPGFQAEAVRIVSPATSSTANAFTFHSGGWAIPGGAHRSWGYASEINASTTNQGARLSTSYACMQVAFDGTVDWGLTIGTHASGFTCTPSASAGSDEVGYLALASATRSFVLASYDAPTSTGNDTESGLGIDPQHLDMTMCYSSSEDAAETDAESGSYGIFVATEAEEFCNAIQMEDGVSTTNTQSLADSKLNTQPHGGGTTDDFIATGPSGSGSFNSGGFTLNYTAVDTGTTRKWFYLAISGDAIGGGPTGGRLSPLAGPFGGAFGGPF